MTTYFSGFFPKPSRHNLVERQLFRSVLAPTWNRGRSRISLTGAAVRSTKVKCALLNRTVGFRTLSGL